MITPKRHACVSQMWEVSEPQVPTRVWGGAPIVFTPETEKKLTTPQPMSVAEVISFEKRFNAFAFGRTSFPLSNNIHHFRRFVKS